MIDKLPAAASTRRTAIARAAVFTLATSRAWAAGNSSANDPDRRQYEAAASQKQVAESWGDQSCGAVVVLDGILVGEGPSRVVKSRDSDAHAEREAIRDAHRRLGRTDVAGSVLRSTSRPYAWCETAATRAGVNRMYFGPSLMDAGRPRSVAQ